MAQPRTRRLVGYAGYGLLHVGFEVPRDSQVGCVAQSRTRSVGYAGYGLLHIQESKVQAAFLSLA